VVNQLAAKKNPLIKSEMIFKPADVRQNPLLPKSNEQAKPKQEIIK